jgi:hypothetical protein
LTDGKSSRNSRLPFFPSSKVYFSQCSLCVIHPTIKDENDFKKFKNQLKCSTFTRSCVSICIYKAMVEVRSDVCTYFWHEIDLMMIDDIAWEYFLIVIMHFWIINAMSTRLNMDCKLKIDHKVQDWQLLFQKLVTHTY